MILLAVFSCGTCSQALLRHWQYFERQQADKNYVIATEDRHCDTPDTALVLRIGLDSYIMGEHLPRRMLDTISILLDEQWDVLILCEYDTLIFNRIPVENLEVIAAHNAGQITTDRGFWHNPWVFSRGIAKPFIDEGRKVIAEGICQEGAPEASPDVFFGRVLERMNQPIQRDLWTQFSRNSLDRAGDLELARDAYRSGVDVIHGVKHEHELLCITQSS